MNAAEEAGWSVLEVEATDEVAATVTRLVNEGRAVWAWDPHVSDVVGLVVPGTDRAWVVVYLDDQDFEVSDDMEMLL